MLFRSEILVDESGNIHGKNFQVFRSENKTKSNKLTNLKLLEDLKKDLPGYKNELDEIINKTDEHIENLATTKKEVELFSQIKAQQKKKLSFYLRKNLILLKRKIQLI